MATYQQSIRRGLPRVAGGEPWPSAIASVERVQRVEIQDPQEGIEAVAPTVAEPVAPAASAALAAAPAAALPAAPAAGPAVTLRRGLPRVAGGEPWPSAIASVEGAQRADIQDPQDGIEAVAPAPVVPEVPASTVPASTAPAAPLPTQTGVAVEMVSENVELRRGLPRVAGGDPWPAAATATVQRAVAASPPVVPGEAASTPPVILREGRSPELQDPRGQSENRQASELEASRILRLASLAQDDGVGEVVAAAPVGVGEVARAVPGGVGEVAAAAPGGVGEVVPSPPVAKPAKPAREPRMIGSRPLAQWVKWGVWGAIGAIVAAGVVVLAARGVTTLPGVPEFVEKYPGEYHIPEVAEPGFPAWARWTHFLNIFLMVLIIRSGLQVRQQQKPPAFWTPKKGGKKISINLWLHTSLDLLWMLNGVVFIVLLFVSGHWARIVPTSWEVFPNAASALLQYLTLDWPTENGWVNYNSLQQLMYFLVVFIAAPLAILTGVRMSEWWPQKSEKLNKIYPAPVARAIHFPTMLFFVLFILIHVFLVLSTGALRNLNHMFAGSDALNWVGFWWFAGGIFVTVAAVFLARPLILAPIASLTGKVSNR